MKRTKKLPSLALVGLVLALSACGGSSSYRNDVVVKEPEPKMIDAFTKFVMNLLVSSPDNQESVAVNDVALTSPDNTEPEIVN